MSSRRAWQSVVLASAWLAACGGTQPAPETAAGAAAPATKPPLSAAALEKMFSAEVAPQATFDVAAPDGSLHAKVEAAAAPHVLSQDGYWAFEAAWTGQSKLTCFFYPQAKDLGGLMAVLTRVTLNKNAPDHRWLALGADHVGPWPYMLGNARYVVAGDGGKVMGDFKLAAAVRGELSIACVLDAPGMNASFERGMRTLLGSIVLAKPSSDEQAAQISYERTRAKADTVALTRRLTFREGKQVVQVDYATGLETDRAGELVATDHVQTTTYEKGKLISGKYAKAVSDQLAYDLTLALDGDTYHVSGTKNGKPLAAAFEVKGGLPDPDHERELVCKVRDGKLPRAELSDYTPDQDALAPSTTTLQKSSTPDADVVLSAPDRGFMLRQKLDANCEVEHGVIEHGGVHIELERIWHTPPGTTRSSGTAGTTSAPQAASLPASALPLGVVPVTGNLAALEHGESARYLLSTPDAAALREQLAAEHPEAKLRDGKLEVTRGALPEAVLPRYLEPSFFVDSDQPEIAALAQQLPPKPTFTDIRELVLKQLNVVRYGDFWTASRASRKRSGDCSEHALLVAALARHAQIPARAVIGFALLSQGPRGVAAGHMWTQLHDATGWHDVDATPLGSTPHAYLVLNELTDESASFQVTQLKQDALLRITSIEVLGAGAN